MTLKFATPSEALDAGLAAVSAVQPIIKEIGDCEHRLSELQLALTQARQDHTSLTENNSHLLRQQHSYRQRLEQLKEEAEAAERQNAEAVTSLQQELEVWSKKRDEAVATYNRTRATMEAMLKIER